MTKDDVLRIWAPPESVWSRFTKPVLFSFLDEGQASRPPAPPKPWDIPLESGVALVIDAPGFDGVALGLSLAARAYRPIPLYNACPAPRLEPMPSVVDVDSIITALQDGAEVLQACVLPAAAPPVFLLDANRRGGGGSISGQYFDNRSFVSTLDVPTAAFLKEQGIVRVVVVQDVAQPQTDLLYILLAWQREGIQILWQTPRAEWKPQAVPLKEPSALARLFRRLVSALGYPKNKHGSFGRIVSSSS